MEKDEKGDGYLTGYEGECVHTGFCGRRKLFGRTRHRWDKNIETDIP